jgi:multidrug efflux pump subunit AcrA (membrane-fusion protein)
MRLLGEVSRIVPTVDRAKATLLVKIAFKERDARVLPDMSAKVAFLARAPQPEERKPVTAVRPEAVVKRGDRSVVYVLDAKNNAKEVAVGTPQKVGDLVTVSNVKAGDRVALNPPEKLKDGATVAIAKK